MQTNKEERVLNYYVLCNKLKDVIRELVGKTGMLKEID